MSLASSPSRLDRRTAEHEAYGYVISVRVFDQWSTWGYADGPRDPEDVRDLNDPRRIAERIARGGDLHCRVCGGAPHSLDECPVARARNAEIVASNRRDYEQHHSKFIAWIAANSEAWKQMPSPLPEVMAELERHEREGHSYTYRHCYEGPTAANYIETAASALAYLIDLPD